MSEIKDTLLPSKDNVIPESMMDNTVKKHSCDKCFQTFHTVSLLKQHLRSHLRPHQCVDCYQRFQFPWQLKAHDRVHEIQRKRGFQFRGRSGATTVSPSAKRLRLSDSEDKLLTPRTNVRNCENILLNSDDNLLADSHDKENKPSSSLSMKSASICDICQLTFPTSPQLKEHLRVAHRRKFSCRRCPTKFSTKTGLQQHVLSRHKINNSRILTGSSGNRDASTVGKTLSSVSTENGSLHCDLCNKSFKLVAQMKRHLTSVHCTKALRPTCKHCSAYFSSLNALKAHLVNHRAEFHKSYPCKHCKKIFSQLSALTDHLKLHSYKPHTNEVSIQADETESDFYCNICPTEFNKRSLYQSHTDSVHAQSHPVQCTICYDRFHADCELKIHTIEHGVELSAEEMILPREYTARVKCGICGQGYKTKGFDSCFRLHMDQAHLETHPYYCLICFNRFETKDEYKLHKKVHRGARPVIDKEMWYLPQSSCNLCLKWNFSYRGPLRNDYSDHMDRSHGDVPLKCEICEDRFEDTADLVEHMIDHRGDDILSDDEDDTSSSYPLRRFHCNVCNTFFLFGRMSYKFHADRFHSETHPHRCNVCFDRFENKLFLKIHSQVHGAVLTEKEQIIPRIYSVPEFKCKICDHKFKEKGFDSEYRFHMDQLHLYTHPFRCEMCVERFQDSSALWWHEKYHISKEPVYDPLLTHVLPYECNVCQKPDFIYRGPGSQYRKHQDQTHESTHPHQCDICFDSFATERDLKCHDFDTLHLHPFRCSLCPTWGFVAWGPDSQYKKHQDKYHSNFTHQCERCHDRFEYQYELYEHIRDGHQNLRERVVKSYWATLEEEKRKKKLAGAASKDDDSPKSDDGDDDNDDSSKHTEKRNSISENENKENTQSDGKENVADTHETYDEVDGEITFKNAKNFNAIDMLSDRKSRRKGIPRRMDDSSENEVKVNEELNFSKENIMPSSQATDGVAESGQGLLDFIGNLVIDINAERAMSTDDSVSSMDGSSQSLKSNTPNNNTPTDPNAIYTCNQCGRVFTRKASYSRHLKFHSGVRPYSCHFCERRFIQSSDLKRHIHTHTGEKTHLCVRCGDKFLHLTQLHRHRKKCTGELNLPLEPKLPRSLPMMNVFPESSAQMGMAYIQSMMLKQKNSLPPPQLSGLPVIGVATPIRPMKLEMNNLPVFPGAPDVMSPISPLSESNDVLKSRPTPGDQTDDSEASIMSNDVLKEPTYIENIPSPVMDIDEVDGITPLKQNRSNAENLSPMANLNSTTGKVSKNTCIVCGRVFNCQNNLARHMRAHTGEKPHGCKYCGKRFIQSSDLKRHIGIHTGKMPFKCEICQQQFVHKHRYTQHMERHGVDVDNVAAYSSFSKSKELDTGIDSFGNSPTAAKDLIRMSILKKIVQRPEETEISEATAKMAVSSLDLSSSDEIKDMSDVSRSFNDSDAKNDSIKKENELTPSDGKKQTFECQYCGKNFKFHALLARHIPKHTGERAFKCSICDKGFIQTSDLKRHMLRHNGYTPHMCQLCFKEFVFEDRLYDHYRTAHKMAKNWIEEEMKQTNSNNENIPNPVAPNRNTMKPLGPILMNKTTFPLSNKMNVSYNDQIPIASRPDDWKFLSARNPMNFTPNLATYPAIAAQLRVAQMTSNPNQDCPLDLSVTSMKLPPMMKEIQPLQPLQPLMMKENNAFPIGRGNKFIDNNGKKFKCEICGREFPLLTSLRRHMMSHSGERQVFCHICGQGFLQVAELSKHMSTHLTPPLNFRCTECSAEFLTEQRLLQHKQIVHRPYQAELQNLVRNDGPNQKSLFMDDSIGRDMVDGMMLKTPTNGLRFDFQKTSTPFKIEMKNANLSSPTSSDDSPINEDEMKDENGKPKKAPYKRPRGVYPCDYCGRVFPYKAALVRHVRVHTGERPFKCDECGHGFIQSSDLKRHLSKHADKGLKCMFCPLQCTSREDLELHARMEHGFTLAPLDFNTDTVGAQNISAEIEQKFKMNSLLSPSPMFVSPDVHYIDKKYPEIATVEVKTGRKSRKGIPKRHIEEIDDVPSNVTGTDIDDEVIRDNDVDQDRLVMNLPGNDSKVGYDEPDGIMMMIPPKLKKESPSSIENTMPPLEKMEIDENHNSPLKVPLQMPILQRMILPSNTAAVLRESGASQVVNNMSMLSKKLFTSAVETKPIVQPLAVSPVTAQEVPKPNADGLYECTFCEKKFRWPCLLTRHIRKHTGEKPFPCTICNKTFLQSSDLKRHMYTHSGNKPFKCTVCSMEFVQRAKLLSHLKKHGQSHEDAQQIADLMSSLASGKLQCKFCKKKFRNEFTLSEHMAEHKLYKCHQCNMTYLNPQDLQLHESTSHSNKGLSVETPPILGILQSQYSQAPVNAPVFPGPVPESVENIREEISDVSYLCSGCDKFFDSKAEYDVHVTKCSA